MIHFSQITRIRPIKSRVAMKISFKKTFEMVIITNYVSRKGGTNHAYIFMIENQITMTRMYLYWHTIDILRVVTFLEIVCCTRKCKGTLHIKVYNQMRVLFCDATQGWYILCKTLHTQQHVRICICMYVFLYVSSVGGVGNIPLFHAYVENSRISNLLCSRYVFWVTCKRGREIYLFQTK